jgi:serine/threonine protein kinase
MFQLLKRKYLPEKDFPGLDAFEKLHVISEGTRSVLYKARGPDGRNVYCLKILKANAAQTIDKIRRIGLKWEGDWSLELKHPNVVEGYYAGKEKDTYFLVLEYLGGSSLLHCIYFEPQRIQGRRLEIGRTVTAAIGFLHQNKIIHRDICPKNFMFDGASHLKLIDFGVALSIEKRTLKRAGVTGTPSYIAPEVFSDRRYDIRTDIYALGVTLFEIFTGTKPFKVSMQETQSALLRHLRQDPPSPRQLNPRISPELEDLILRAMARSPSERIESTIPISLVLESLSKSAKVSL